MVRLFSARPRACVEWAGYSLVPRRPPGLAGFSLCCGSGVRLAAAPLAVFVGGFILARVVELGRHATLKMWCSSGRAGSSPATGTCVLMGWGVSWFWSMSMRLGHPRVVPMMVCLMRRFLRVSRRCIMGRRGSVARMAGLFCLSIRWGGRLPVGAQITWSRWVRTRMCLSLPWSSCVSCCGGMRLMMRGSSFTGVEAFCSGLRVGARTRCSRCCVWLKRSARPALLVGVRMVSRWGVGVLRRWCRFSR